MRKIVPYVCFKNQVLSNATLNIKLCHIWYSNGIVLAIINGWSFRQPAEGVFATMFNGTVKWFSNPHGYGFILDDNGQDIFVHYSVIQQDGYKTLQEGQEVQYEKADGPKGIHATIVQPEATVKVK